MKIKSIEYWNSLKLDDVTNAKAVEGDIVVLINGVVFLIQRKNDRNNIVCFRVRKSKKSILYTFNKFREFCELSNIQYITVKGNTHRYRMLELLRPYSPVNADVIKHEGESKRLNCNVFCVKCY